MNNFLHLKRQREMLCKGGVRVSEECIDFSQEQESEDSLREREGDNEGNIYKP